VVEALTTLSDATYQGQRGIAGRGEHFRRVIRVDACLIFVTADITYVMKTILGAPTRARQSEQLFTPRTNPRGVSHLIPLPIRVSDRGEWRGTAPCRAAW
jgi:hypothetical protein